MAIRKESASEDPARGPFGVSKISLGQSDNFL